MSFAKCTICGEYHFSDQKCPTLFFYLIPEYGDYWEKIRADSFEEAAEKACDNDDYNSAEYSIVKNGSLDKILIKDVHGTIKAFSITAEAVPMYHASEIEVTAEDTAVSKEA